MLGQSLVEPEDEERVELLDGVVLVDPEELELVPLEPVELVPVELVPVEFELDVVVAALATSAPPVTRPAVSALKATAFRKRSFMVVCPFWLWTFVCFPT
jgi:hypothetical protein